MLFALLCHRKIQQIQRCDSTLCFGHGLSGICKVDQRCTANTLTGVYLSNTRYEENIFTTHFFTEPEPLVVVEVQRFSVLIRNALNSWPTIIHKIFAKQLYRPNVGIKFYFFFDIRIPIISFLQSSPDEPAAQPATQALMAAQNSATFVSGCSGPNFSGISEACMETNEERRFVGEDQLFERSEARQQRRRFRFHRRPQLSKR